MEYQERLSDAVMEHHNTNAARRVTMVSAEHPEPSTSSATRKSNFRLKGHMLEKSPFEFAVEKQYDVNVQTGKPLQSEPEKLMREFREFRGKTSTNTSQDEEDTKTTSAQLPGMRGPSHQKGNSQGQRPCQNSRQEKSGSESKGLTTRIRTHTGMR